MNIASLVRVNQLVPISKARASLPTLVEEVSKKDFLVLVRKYKPKAALVNLDFLENLLRVYYQWRREQDFATLDKIRESVPTYKAGEVEEDIKNALTEIRRKS